jgi:hypothetical protein
MRADGNSNTRTTWAIAVLCKLPGPCESSEWHNKRVTNMRYGSYTHRPLRVRALRQLWPSPYFTGNSSIHASFSFLINRSTS